jgi:hypothetical protein
LTEVLRTWRTASADLGPVGWPPDPLRTERTRRTGTGCQEPAVRWTRTASAILAGEESAVSPSIPGVRRPALRWATYRTLTSVLLRATF